MNIKSFAHLNKSNLICFVSYIAFKQCNYANVSMVHIHQKWKYLLHVRESKLFVIKLNIITQLA